jgi:hypothetical protein
MEEFGRRQDTDVVFFDRSLFTPFVFRRSASSERLGLYMDLMDELR